VNALGNIRDVGGLELASGGVVRRGVLYRSDAPHPGDSPPELDSWPPRTVIDLRSVSEAATDHPLAGVGALIRIPLFDDGNPLRMGGADRGDAVGLTEMYQAIVRSAGPALVEVVSEVARRPAPVLVHCSAGKDRTGVVFALILSAVGVRREAIVADYLRTEANMPQVQRRLAKSWGGLDGAGSIDELVAEHAHLFAAPAAAIETVLDDLHADVNGVEGWLLRRGLPREQLSALRRRLAP
jgi:protein-tyrosine phosphatase